MPKTIYAGRVTGAVIHDHPGRLRGFLVSHAQTSAQTVTFYDNAGGASGTVLLAVHVAPEACPVYVLFPRDDALAFANGLSAAYPNCELCVWSVGFEG